MTKTELSNLVYNKIKYAAPFSTINLPEIHIILPCILMKHPLNIIGSPGTVLEILNGNIVCDFRDFARENPTLDGQNMRSTISEITLIFRVEPFKIASKMNEVAAKKSYEEITYSE